MNKNVFFYGLLGGLLIALLKVVEYRFLVVQYSVEIYGGLIAAIFAGLGVWLGLRLTRSAAPSPGIVTVAPIAATTPFVRNATQVASLGVTPRELEILELIAQGLSNREIAEKLFVSENTVKTHSSRVFDKLGAKRRTQAVQLGKQRGLIA
jgi:NarL family two-component system response regulator LiaR